MFSLSLILGLGFWARAWAHSSPNHLLSFLPIEKEMLLSILLGLIPKKVLLSNLFWFDFWYFLSLFLSLSLSLWFIFTTLCPSLHNGQSRHHFLFYRKKLPWLLIFFFSRESILIFSRLIFLTTGNKTFFQSLLLNPGSTAMFPENLNFCCLSAPRNISNRNDLVNLASGKPVNLLGHTYVSLESVTLRAPSFVPSCTL